MEESKAEDSISLSTVDEIQRRLARPLSPRFHSSTSSTRSPRYDIDRITSSIESQRKNKRLEDYLDPALLSAIRAKIVGKRKRGEVKVKELEFEWPGDELKVLRSEKGVDLGDDVDVIGGVGEEDEMCCTPFRRFERTALKRFKG